MKLLLSRIFFSFIFSDLRSVKYFVGIELSRSSQGIFFLSQRKYCLQILEDTGTPLSTKDATTYRRLLGHLLYL